MTSTENKRSKITVNIQAVSVTGRILERTATALEVELLHPFGRLKDGRSVMAAARPYVSFDGAHGDDVFIEILTDIYRAAAYVDEHLHDLKKRWGVMRRQLDERCHLIVRSHSEYVEERAKSRRMLREGLITSDDHEGWLIELRHHYEEWSLLVADAVDFLFAESGIDISYDLQRQLLRRIDLTFEIDHEAAEL